MVARWMVLLAGMWGAAQEAPVFLSPVHESVVAPGALRVVAKGAGKGQIALDGKPLLTTSEVDGVFHAEVKLEPGEHEFVLKSSGGEARSKVFAGKEHSSWKMFRQHPPAATCDTCHAVKAGAWATKRITLSPLCHQCHEAEKFPAVHTHATDTLADCQNCHLPHGSTAAKAHLKQASKELACRQCHSYPL